MAELVVRRAVRADFIAMASLWHEKMLLQQQTDLRYALLPDSQARWTAALEPRLNDARWAIFVAESEAGVIGYIMACLRASPPGLVPEQVGVIEDIAVSIHSQHNGLGRGLLEPVRQWFVEQGITRMVATVARFQPVEQAFWRAIGARDVADTFWMKL